MKLVRYGRPGAERPGAIDADGKLHDLGRVIKDVTPAALAPAMLKKLRAVNLARLPVVRGRPRLGTQKYDLAFSRGKLASKRDLNFATGHMLKRHLLIITRRAPRTYEAMKQSFGGYAGIDVILDLRYRQRRWKWWCKRAIEIRE